MNVRSIFFAGFGAACAALASGQTYRIASGEWDALGSQHPVLRFLEASQPFGSNAIVDVEADAPFAASVANLDSVDHVLVIDDVEWNGVDIPAGDTVSFEWPALPMGSYRYHLAGERGSYLQASGVLRSGIDAEHGFVWHVADLEAALLDTVAAGGAWNAATYTPDFFTINEAHYPHTLDDPWALVSVQLGDSAVISVANAGQMDHVFHFHGFHVEILQSTRSPERVGWLKDSVPVRRGEGLTLLLVPDQTGTYPVHDHNLIAVTNAGFYPGGMLTQIIVAP
jgi:hypothetical protein